MKYILGIAILWMFLVDACQESGSTTTREEENLMVPDTVYNKTDTTSLRK